jgi:hypothetical protein
MPARSGEGARSPAVAAAPTPAPAPADQTVALLDDPPAPRSAVAVGGRRSSPRFEPAEPSAPSDVTPPAFSSVGQSPSALAEESRLVTAALRKLRQDDDGRGALAILDEHDARFAAGDLAPEAALARIEALIKIRRNADALALLDRMAPPPLGTGRGLLIARAELRAAGKRCASAFGDFDLLLRGDPTVDSITERAWWGRASCRAAGGDALGARADLRSYLAHFPSGRFAIKARAALGD